MEIYLVAAGTLIAILSAGVLFLYLHNQKLKAALRKQQTQSDMWRKSAESIFVMAQKDRQQEIIASEQHFILN